MIKNLLSFINSGDGSITAQGKKGLYLISANDTAKPFSVRYADADTFETSTGTPFADCVTEKDAKDLCRKHEGKIEK